jgi:bifunctional UDP-N-acetylglucosamine pyrophosphorylase/glucosamine-1-phosphate N-acetyltransferase
MDNIAAVILAAGKGTRMAGGDQSPIPKVMYEISGKPIISYSVQNLKNAGIDTVVVVVGYQKESIENFLGEKVLYAVQTEQLGTGHAVMAAREKLAGESEAVLVCYGDMPLFKPSTIKSLIEVYDREKPAIAMLSIILDDPEFWAFGRIVRNEAGDVVASIEQRDCNEEQLKIKESNPCFYIFNSHWLWSNLDKLSTENAQGEYYLTDIIKVAIDQGKKIIAMPITDETEALGINTPEQLKMAEEILAKNRKS